MSAITIAVAFLMFVCIVFVGVLVTGGYLDEQWGRDAISALVGAIGGGSLVAAAAKVKSNGLSRDDQ